MSDIEKRVTPPSSDPAPGEVVGDVIPGDYGADSELQRRLSSRHITMIALGSSIGMGLWLGSGTSLHEGGPAAIFIGCKSFSLLFSCLTL
jgi:amino acid transporter